jgi:hypothetical protein
MLRRMSTDKDFRVAYEVSGREYARTITLSAGQYVDPEMVEYNCRVIVRMSTPFKTQRQFDSFKILHVEEA